MQAVTESAVEEIALVWLKSLGIEILSGVSISPTEPATERADYKQVFLLDRLQAKLTALKPKIPTEGLQEALRKIRLFSHPTLIENNRAFHRLLVEGVDVEFRNRDGQIVHDKVWLIDFANPEANEFLAVNQFTVEEGHFNRRADVVVFINGIPLAVLELLHGAWVSLRWQAGEESNRSLDGSDESSSAEYPRLRKTITSALYCHLELASGNADEVLRRIDSRMAPSNYYFAKLRYLAIQKVLEKPGTGEARRSELQAEVSAAPIESQSEPTFEDLPR